MKTYVPPRKLLAALSEVLTSKTRPLSRGRTTLRNTVVAESPLQQGARLLQTGRNYLAVTIYLNFGERTYRVASSGPEFSCESMGLGEALVGKTAQSGAPRIVSDVSKERDYRMVHQDTRSELVMPIKLATRVFGVVDVESGELNSFGGEDRVLIKEAAGKIALFLSSTGKYLLTRLRESAKSAPRVREVPAKHPQAEPAPTMRAAAGESSRS